MRSSRVAAGEEVRARLQADEAGVAADEHLQRGAVAVAGLEHELEILKLALSLLRRVCVRSASGHGHLPVLRNRPALGRTLTLNLREKIARGPKSYKSICDGPNMRRTCVRKAIAPRRSRSSAASVAGSSLSRRSPRGPLAVRGRHELGEERRATRASAPRRRRCRGPPGRTRRPPPAPRAGARRRAARSPCRRRPPSGPRAARAARRRRGRRRRARRARPSPPPSSRAGRAALPASAKPPACRRLKPSKR